MFGKLRCKHWHNSLNNGIPLFCRNRSKQNYLIRCRDRLKLSLQGMLVWEGSLLYNMSAAWGRSIGITNERTALWRTVTSHPPYWPLHSRWCLVLPLVAAASARVCVWWAPPAVARNVDSPWASRCWTIVCNSQAAVKKCNRFCQLDWCDRISL